MADRLIDTETEHGPARENVVPQRQVGHQPLCSRLNREIKINKSLHAGWNSVNKRNFKTKSHSNLKVIDVFSIIYSTHILHQYVQLAANVSSYIDGYFLVPFKNPNSHLFKKITGIIWFNIG